jgi:hypothetical protein
MSSIITIEVNNLLTEYVRTRPITHSAQLDQRIVMIIVGFVGTYVAVISGWFRSLCDKLYKRVYPDPINEKTKTDDSIYAPIDYESKDQNVIQFKLNVVNGSLHDDLPLFLTSNVVAPSKPLINNYNNFNDYNTCQIFQIDRNNKNGDITTSKYLGNQGCIMGKSSTPMPCGYMAELIRIHEVEFEKRKIIVAKWKEWRGGGNNSNYWHLYITKNIGDTNETISQISTNFIKTAIDFINPKNETTFKLYEIINGEWKTSGTLSKKSKDTLVGENTRYILDDIDFFQTKIKDVYKTFDIPYKRGYMLYGPPGTGKTSTVKCVASHANMNIYKVTFNEENMGNDDYIRLLSETDPFSIVLMEDIDPALLQEGGFIEKECSTELPPPPSPPQQQQQQQQETIDEKSDTVKGRPPKGGKGKRQYSIMSSLYENLSRKKKRVSYGMLLDALDGINANSGRITFITTNHPSKIGKALLRPGRIDVKIKMDYASNDEICEYFKMFYTFFSLNHDIVLDGAERFIKKVRNHPSGCKISFAQLQQHLVRHLRNINMAVEKAYTMFEPEEYEDFM